MPESSRHDFAPKPRGFGFTVASPVGALIVSAYLGALFIVMGVASGLSELVGVVACTGVFVVVASRRSQGAWGWRWRD